MQIYHLAADTESKTIKSFYFGKLANVTKTERILINEIYCKKKKRQQYSATSIKRTPSGPSQVSA